MNKNDCKFAVSLPKGYDIGFTMIENFILDIEELSPEKKMVLIMLRRYVGSHKNTETGLIEADSKAAYPSINNLASKCGLSRQTVIKSIDFLQWIQWVTKESTKKENGEKGVNNYTLNVPAINVCLGIFNEKEISFSEIESYYDCLYKHKNKGGLEILNRGCIFLSNSYDKKLVEELILEYKKPPKKRAAK